MEIVRGSDTQLIIEAILSKEDVMRLVSNNPSSEMNYIQSLFSSELVTKYGVIMPMTKNSQKLLPVNPQLNRSRKLSPTRSIYDDVFPSTIRDSSSGSEKYLDVVIRNSRMSTRLKKKRGWVPSPILDISNAQKLDELPTGDLLFILLVDNIASGTQAVDFIEMVALSLSIGPLRGKTVHLQVVAWTATLAGIRKIEEWYKCIDAPRFTLEIQYLNETKSFKNTSLDRKSLFDLFAKYGNPDSNLGLGFGGAATRSVIVGNLCPNNLPDLFIYHQPKIKYYPIFESREIPPDIKDQVLAMPGRSFDGTIDPKLRLAVETGKLRAALTRPGMKGDPSWQILLCAVVGFGRDEGIRIVGASYDTFCRAEARLRTLEWLTDKFAPTEAGLHVVRTYAERKNRADYAASRHYMKRRIDASQITYYPSSLRGVR
ncbi:hypothetical protein KRR55_20100 [Paeniglutamicibacter sp. ABSL32-1]|nr:hypothetical protein [Paeniglutamicibacter quisquiliarum]MBV1781406.1 hypothetical protein [Paeniglutamicibacter quisquiliarum]